MPNKEVKENICSLNWKSIANECAHTLKPHACNPFFNGYFVSIKFKQINLIPHAFKMTLTWHEITSGAVFGAIYI